MHAAYTDICRFVHPLMKINVPPKVLLPSYVYFRTLIPLIMKKIFTLSVLILSLFTVAQAQKADGTIKGKLLDTASKQPISDATISVLNTKDSALATFTLSNKQGAFEIKGLEAGNYQLVISHLGFETFKKTVAITATEKSIDLGSLGIPKEIKTLEGVVVTTDAPVIIKNDTI